MLARMMSEDYVPEDLDKEDNRPRGILICCHHYGRLLIRNSKHLPCGDRPDFAKRCVTQSIRSIAVAKQKSGI